MLDLAMDLIPSQPGFGYAVPAPAALLFSRLPQGCRRSCRMKSGQLEQLIDAVLLDGHSHESGSAPSRSTAPRFTIGCIYPEVFTANQADVKTRTTQTECLFCPHSSHGEIEVTVRFLQSLSRTVGRVRQPVPDWPARREPPVDLVAALEIEHAVFASGLESIRREITASIQPGSEPIFVPFIFLGCRTLEPLRDASDQVVAFIVRQQPAIAGAVELSTEPAGTGGAFRLKVRVVNRSSVTPSEQRDLESVRPRTFTSAHAILHAHAADFISLNDPPPPYAQAAAACENVGLWPVLLGDQARQAHDAMLAAPTILPDYPPIATEAADRLFDRLEEFATGGGVADAPGGTRAMQHLW